MLLLLLVVRCVVVDTRTCTTLAVSSGGAKSYVQHTHVKPPYPEEGVDRVVCQREARVPLQGEIHQNAHLVVKVVKVVKVVVVSECHVMVVVVVVGISLLPAMSFNSPQSQR